MFLTGSAIHFTRIVGLSPTQVGLGLSVAGLVGLLGSVPLGMLGDRWGPGRVYVALQLWRGLGYTVYAAVSGFPGFVVTATATEIGDAALPAIAQAVVSLSVPEEERVETLAKVRAVRNVGFGLGAAATGVLALEVPLGTAVRLPPDDYDTQRVAAVIARAQAYDAVLDALTEAARRCIPRIDRT